MHLEYLILMEILVWRLVLSFPTCMEALGGELAFDLGVEDCIAALHYHLSILYQSIKSYISNNVDLLASEMSLPMRCVGGYLSLVCDTGAWVEGLTPR